MMTMPKRHPSLGPPVVVLSVPGSSAVRPVSFVIVPHMPYLPVPLSFGVLHVPLPIYVHFLQVFVVVLLLSFLRSRSSVLAALLPPTLVLCVVLSTLLVIPGRVLL